MVSSVGGQWQVGSLRFAALRALRAANGGHGRGGGGASKAKIGNIKWFWAGLALWGHKGAKKKVLKKMIFGCDFFFHTHTYWESPTVALSNIVLVMILC